MHLTPNTDENAVLFAAPSGFTSRMNIARPGVALLLLLAAALATAQTTDVAAASASAASSGSAVYAGQRQTSTPQDEAEEQLQVTAAGLAASRCAACTTSAFQPVCGALPGVPEARHTIMSPCLAACQGIIQFSYGPCPAASSEGEVPRCRACCSRGVCCSNDVSLVP
jgi:hypothetical protein